MEIVKTFFFSAVIYGTSCKMDEENGWPTKTGSRERSITRLHFISEADSPLNDQIRSNKNTPYTNKVDCRKWIIEKTFQLNQNLFTFNKKDKKFHKAGDTFWCWV